jgi:hypothetical protein
MERLTWIGCKPFSSQLFVGSSEQCGSSRRGCFLGELGSALAALAARCLHPDPQRHARGIRLAWGRLRWCRVPRPREARQRCSRTHRRRGGQSARCGTRQRRGGWRRHHSHALPPAEKKEHRRQPPSADPRQPPPPPWEAGSTRGRCSRRRSGSEKRWGR